ncbi:glycoside hydrolase [Blyttiomyces helicus]|uniref:Glycoside hydrolase n=1 Tax=Blyttiomyces helicus TaxID=388810 RepID=A0A4P9WRK8_9FUNG|nr:glycoside hydrolase [Blyttiomyces helicus]|eukprot:RKO94518.1 glycoside hydrolase [Blyttiomyces helicus]
MTSAVASPYYETPTKKHGVFYHTNWSCYARNYQVKDLPISNMTDIVYAFFNIAADGTVSSGDTWADFQNPFIGNGVPPQNTWSSPSNDLGLFGQFQKLRQQGSTFNLALAIGGWTWSTNFSTAMSTAVSRQNIVTSLTNILKPWPGLFNGICIDWEYLSDNGVNYGNAGNTVSSHDATNFIEFLKLLREEMKGFRIYLAVTAAPENIKMPVQSIHPLVDEFHVMTYDFHSSSFGDTITGHQTNLRPSSYGTYSVEEAVSVWLGYGVPSSKIFIGAALYSRGFANTGGLGKSCSGTSPDMSWEPGVVDYKSLPLPGAVELWDPLARAGYSFDSVKRLVNSYDTVESVKEKCQFVFDNDLGGIICWETSADFPYENPKSLIKTIYNNLTHGSAEIASDKVLVKPTAPGQMFSS